MKIAILGGSPSLKEFDREGWDEVWALGNQAQRPIQSQADTFFEIHDDLSEHGNPMEYAQWLIGLWKPVIVGPNFPVTDQMVKVFDKKRANSILGEGMLSSSPAYMMAQAIMIEADEIGLFGVDMAVDDHEYFKQRPAMYAWIAYAKARDIKVTVNKESSLFKDKYDEGRDWGKKPSGPFTEDTFSEMAQFHIDKIQEYTKLVETHDGCRQVYQRLSKVARAVESGQTVANLTDSLLIKE